MEKTKKIISILLVFLLSIGVCCNFKVFAQESNLSEQEEYNQKVIEEFGLNDNPTESPIDTQNQETNKQHILDDEPKTGLVF